MNKLSDDAIRFFRAKRAGLIHSPYQSASQVLRAVLGAQSQQLNPALWGIALRMNRPASRDELLDELFGVRPQLCRTWGQRDTVHIYHAEDWPTMLAAKTSWPACQRRGWMPSDEELDEVVAYFSQAGRPLGRSHIMPQVSQAQIDESAKHFPSESDMSRMSATRLIWAAASRGDLCIGPMIDGEQTYVARDIWFEGLSKVETGHERQHAIDWLLRYLQTYGPATVHDAAHFFGAKIGEMNKLLSHIKDLIIEVTSDDGKLLWALRTDLAELQQPLPADDDLTGWPLKLLPMWDGTLMGHRDKDFISVNKDEQKAVWKRSAVVMSVVLARGQIVATWSKKETKTKLAIEVQPLSNFRKKIHSPAIEHELEVYAAHANVKLASVDYAN